MIFGINTKSDISKLSYVISQAVRRVKFETILKYHEWHLCQISHTNHAIICLYYYPQKVCNFTCRYFKLSWNTTSLTQSNCRNFSCSSLIARISPKTFFLPILPKINRWKKISFFDQNHGKANFSIFFFLLLLVIV